ncbi:MAG TPA: SDR family NAD(P)-dependent oxidoreductase [Ideonella sp.]|uniref:SDR family NAD(P)-dependent oxidoreductase n=1 Tax=Ideonella sp. TaxID=1929293 RepID=UPI002C52A0C5|nr:SDR family NAD(P)-dependent oxidoreductase [Ideonella sp.]HSI48889.1 SDR family NAD(P)-dependent oxidoreductase [Ideonella sp.]
MNAPHVLVTGANRGIGAAIAHALAANGWRVTLAGRSIEALEATRAVLPGDGHAVVQMDVASADSITRAFAEARAAQGPLHALVNNAGMVETGPTQRFALAAWERLLDVNLTGVFLCCQAAIADLRGTQGRIVNIASTAAQKGYAFTAAYAAAKHGVVGFTRSLALELAPAGIAVNAVCPGYTDTDIVRGGMAQIMDKKGKSEAEALQSFTQANPMQRLVRPDEVAEVVRWLCRQAPAAITGQSISISGGEVM